MTNPRFIIFDLDGTLVDSAKCVTDAVNYALAKEGLPTQDYDRIAAFIGYPLEETFAAFTDLPYEQLYRHFTERAGFTMVEGTRKLPGAEAVLRELHDRNYTMAIASTKRRSNIDVIVDAMGWAELFAALRGGDEVERVKPAPDIFLSVLDELGSSATDTIVVGDTVNDVLAARACNLTVVAVESPYGNHDDMRNSKPDHIISSISELPGLLNGHSVFQTDRQV